MGVTEYISKKELRDVGLETVNDPFVTIGGQTYVTIGGQTYCCVTRRIFPITKKCEFKKMCSKGLVLAIILDSGFTHILDVKKEENWFSFGLKNLEKSCSIVMRGFTKLE